MEAPGVPVAEPVAEIRLDRRLIGGPHAAQQVPARIGDDRNVAAAMVALGLVR